MARLLLPILALLPLAAASLSPIHVEDGHFVDQEGRVRLFHGINSVIKGFPWFDPKMRDPVRHQQLADWGFTAVRLGAMWTGLQPEGEDAFNETYVEILKEIVAGLGSHGIYTYLDMHQDVLTAAAGYWGIPPWLEARMAPPAHAYPWPMAGTEGWPAGWACGYFAQQISHQFHQLYTEHQREFANVWRGVARRFKGDPNILGYELLNEPWSGDIYRDASLLLPGNSGFELLQPFYDAASAGIREEDDETIIFWEPVTYAYIINTKPDIILDGVLDAFLRSHQFTEFLPVLEKACGPMAAGGLTPSWAALGHQLLAEVAAAQLHRFNNVASESGRPSSLGPGFTAPPGGWDYLNRTAMSWHYYCWALTGHNNDPYDPAMRGLCDEVMGPMVFNTVAARAEELRGSATMLTEFGICEPSFDLPDSQGNIECNFVLRQADSHFQSWSYWDTAGGGYLWDGEGNPVMDHVKVFARPHPQATAGRPVSFQYDPDSRVMHYQYVPDPSLAAATTVYVPELLYPSGYTVTGSPSLQWATDEANPQLLLITATDAEPSRVIIRPVE